MSLRRARRAARREDALPYGSAGTRLLRGLAPADSLDQRRAIGSAGERLVHTEEVTGSIPVSPTRSAAGCDLPTGRFCYPYNTEVQQRLAAEPLAELT